MNKTSKVIIYCVSTAVIVLLFSRTTSAATLSDAANNIVEAIDGISGLLIALAYVCGLGYAVSAILKFKNHKDNPQQMPISTPVTELFMALALLFLPTIAQMSGVSIFGKDTEIAAPIKSNIEKKKNAEEQQKPPTSRPYIPNQIQQTQPSNPNPNSSQVQKTQPNKPPNPAKELENSDEPYYYVPE